MLSAITLPPRHLTDVAFRFGPDAAPPISQAPRTDAPTTWALDEVLGALARGARVFESRTGLRLLHAHRRPGFAQALPECSDEVRAWLELAMTSRPVPEAVRAWPLRVRLYLAWLDEVLLPSGIDITLGPGIRVTDPTAFRAAVLDRLVAGPESASAAVLLCDLSALFHRYSSLRRQPTSPARRIPLAA